MVVANYHALTFENLEFIVCRPVCLRKERKHHLQQRKFNPVQDSPFLADYSPYPGLS